ncbi:MAG: TonB-dependent receptor [Flavobacteriaceae bacterium]|nr:MAG: TonB-dependent receptor [Flavobacteriaceae bacterium]
MRKLHLIIGLFLVSIHSYGQQFIGTLLDKETKQAIPYAEIYIIDLATGTTTNEYGIFKIAHFNQPHLQVRIQSMGYEVLNTTLLKSALNKQTFYLNPSHYNLEEIILSVPKGQLQSSTTVNIAHSKMATLQQSAPISLAEAISEIPGVSQNTTGAGIGKPVIRGLSGNRIVTYAQGIRVENQQWGSEHGLGVGEIGIESIEVIKGPASLLYGSDALGGVLYFKDERYTKDNNIAYSIGNTYLSNTHGFQTNLGLKLHKNRLKFNVFGSHASHSDYKTPKSGRVFNTRFNEKNIKTAIGFDSNNWIGNLRYSYLENNFGIVEEAKYQDSKSKKHQLPYQNISNHSVSLDQLFYTGDSKINIILGYTSNYRREFEDDKKQHALGLKLNTFTYNARWTSPIYKKYFDLVVGVQGMKQKNKNNGEEILIPDANTRDAGVFTLGNFKRGNLNIQGGIRMDARHIKTNTMHSEETNFLALKKSYNGLTFSSGAIYTFDKIKLRANISSGFRAPSTSELLSYGVHEGTDRFEKGNRLLKSEKARQIDFSVSYQNDHINLSINPFYNKIDNYIYLAPTGSSIDTNPVYEYLQTNAFLYGGELGFHYHPHSVHWLHLESNLSTVFAEDSNNNALPLIPQTRINTTISAEFNSKKKIRLKNIFIKHQYKFQQKNIGIFESETPSYHLLNIGCNVAIKTKSNPLEIKAGVRNIGNTHYIDHLSRFKEMGIPNQGINYYLGIKLQLSTKI